MKYPVAVWNTDGAYTGEIPNLPGVVTEADSIEELEASIKEAAAVWMEAELDCGRAIPAPTSIESYPEAMASENKGCLWMLVDINMADLSDKTERANVCLPSRVLRRLDFLAKKSGESRSGYLSRLVISQGSGLPS